MSILLSTIFILLVLFLPFFGGIVSFTGAFVLKKSPARICLIISVFTLGILSIVFVPFIRNDLYRYFQTMQVIAPIGNLSQFFEFSKYYSTLQYQNNPLFNLIEFGIAKTHYFYLLPYIDSVICYISILYPIFDLKEQGKVNKGMALWLAIGATSVFYFFYIMTYIRWSLASALFILVTYLYFVKLKKVKYIWIFIIPVLFHLGILPAIIIAVYIALQKKVNFYHILIPIPFFIIFVCLSMIVNVNGSSNIVFKMIKMFQGYTVIAKPQGFADWTVFIANLLGTWILVFVALKMSKKNKNKMYYLLVLQSIFYVFLLTSLQITERYSLLISMLSLIIISYNYNDLDKNSRLVPILLISISILIKLYAAYLKFKGMQFTVPLSTAVFSNIFFFIKQLFTSYPIIY